LPAKLGTRIQAGKGLPTYAPHLIISAKAATPRPSPTVLDGPATRGRQDAGAPRVVETMTEALTDRLCIA